MEEKNKNTKEKIDYGTADYLTKQVKEEMGL